MVEGSIDIMIYVYPVSRRSSYLSHIIGAKWFGYDQNYTIRVKNEIKINPTGQARTLSSHTTLPIPHIE